MNNIFHASVILFGMFFPTVYETEPWKMHTIDNTSQGADGVRMADVNGDGFLDIATGWEEGGVVRVYINPGYEDVKMPWKYITVGKVDSPEDAVLVDLDADGNMDVVTCCEGKIRTVFVHWAPENPTDYMDESKWVTEAIHCTKDQQMWMFCMPMQVDRRDGVDLVIGSKGSNATIGWLQSPSNPRNLYKWKYHPIYDASWIMSIKKHDMNQDGLMDIVFSDRKKDSNGVKWLLNLGEDTYNNQSWFEYPIGGSDVEVMFMDVADLNQDSLMDAVVAVYTKQLIYMRCSSILNIPHWEIFPIDIPNDSGIGKAVKVADINLDGKMDIAFTTEKAEQHGVMWMEYDKSPTERQWKPYPIAGDKGIKFDRIEMVDLDNDGDLDLLTCEERDQLGVIWYENPTN